MFKFIISISFIFSPVLYAKKPTTKSVMQDTFYSMIQLVPYMSSEMRFKDQSLEKDINKHLNKMVSSFKTGKHIKMLNSRNFQPNKENLIENLEKASVHFNSGNKSFALLRLNETINLCSSCHTQLSNEFDTTPLLKAQTKLNSHKLDHYELANIYLILRNYKKAYNQYFTYLGQSKSYNKKYIRALNKLIYINAKAENSPNKSLKTIEKMKQSLFIPDSFKEELNQYEKRAKFWSENKSLLETNSIENFISYLEDKIDIKDNLILSGAFDYDLMLISGLLGKKFFKVSQKDQGKILYWLGLAEYRIGRSIFYNTGDQYLKSCIQLGSKNSYAKKCYDSLRSEIEYQYTGSKGTEIPNNIKVELKALKSYIE